MFYKCDICGLQGHFTYLGSKTVFVSFVSLHCSSHQCWYYFYWYSRVMKYSKKLKPPIHIRVIISLVCSIPLKKKKDICSWFCYFSHWCMYHIPQLPFVQDLCFYFIESGCTFVALCILVEQWQSFYALTLQFNSPEQVTYYMLFAGSLLTIAIAGGIMFPPHSHEYCNISVITWWKFYKFSINDSLKSKINYIECCFQKAKVKQHNSIDFLH